MKRLSLIAACLLIVSAFAVSPMMAADFPERPITLLVGFAPGGSLDLSARALASAAENPG